MSDLTPNPSPTALQGPPSRTLLISALERVARQLRGAADRYEKDPAGDALHDVRVALRRATAAAGLFRGFPGKRDGSRLRQRARALRKLLSAVRQQEVSTQLIRGLTTARLAVELAVRLPEAPKPETANVVRIVRSIADGLASWSGRVGRSRRLSADALSRRLTRRVRKRRRALLDGGVPRRSTLHAQRVAGKALRYQLELLEGVEPSVARLLAACRRYQEALGTAHDHACLVSDVTVALSGLTAARRRQAEALLPELARLRSQKFREARAEARRFLRLLSRTRPKVTLKT